MAQLQQTFRNRSVISRTPRRDTRATVRTMLPISDGLTTRRFPVVNVALIAANFAVWILYQLVEANFGFFGARANGGGLSGGTALRAPA